VIKGMLIVVCWLLGRFVGEQGSGVAQPMCKLAAYIASLVESVLLLFLLFFKNKFNYNIVSPFSSSCFF
jgi:hypothetical protein